MCLTPPFGGRLPCRAWGHRTRHADRPKAGQPTMRPACGCSTARPSEPIILCRWRRLPRAAAEQRRRRGGDGPLMAFQCRYWTAAVCDGIAESLPTSQVLALEIASDGIARGTGAFRHEEWRIWQLGPLVRRPYVQLALRCMVPGRQARRHEWSSTLMSRRNAHRVEREPPDREMCRTAIASIKWGR